jgi:hypothetical protein
MGARPKGIFPRRLSPGRRLPHARQILTLKGAIARIFHPFSPFVYCLALAPTPEEGTVPWQPPVAD